MYLLKKVILYFEVNYFNKKTDLWKVPHKTNLLLQKALYTKPSSNTLFMFRNNK